jgi:(p)ppGpp synthase/HD superfamily hydrolase
MTDLIKKAREFAEKAHEGQTRWGGEPYITHPQAVAELVEQMGGGETSIAVAWLHDVVEDCDVTSQDLSNKITPDVAHGVYYVTHKDTDEYHEYIDAMLDGPISALLTKIADLTHNLSTLPVGRDGKKNKQRAEKYKLARWVLLRELQDRYFDGGSISNDVYTNTYLVVDRYK